MDQTCCNDVLNKLKGLLDQVQHLKAVPQPQKSQEIIDDVMPNIKNFSENRTIRDIKPKYYFFNYITNS